jgi:hypothetical protein
MTDDSEQTDDAEAATERETELGFETTDVELKLDASRTTAYEVLVEEFGENVIENTLERRVNQLVTELFDNRQQLRAQQAAQQQPQGTR